MDTAVASAQDGLMSKKSQVWLSVSLVLALLIGAGAFAVFRLPMLKSTAAGEAARDLAEGQLSSDIWHDSDLAQDCSTGSRSRWANGWTCDRSPSTTSPKPMARPWQNSTGPGRTSTVRPGGTAPNCR